MNNIKDIPFSSNLKVFLEKLSKIEWQTKYKNALVVRDYENLPERSPKDVDWLISKDLWKPFINNITEIASEESLVCVSQTLEKGALILVIDPRDIGEQRTWLYFEIREQIDIGNDNSISAVDVDIQYNSFLPIPSDSWRLLFMFLQSIRKNKVNKYYDEIEKLVKEDSNNSFQCRKYFDVSDENILEILNDKIKIDKFRDDLNLRLPVPKKIYTDSWKTKLKDKIFKKIYIMNIYNPELFILSGPDGVGKTTICSEVNKIFSRLPLPFTTFHHITGWKRGMNSEKAKANGNISKVNDVGIIHKILRIIYRNLPDSIKQVWVISSGYHIYSKNLNISIFSNYKKNRIMLVDRYIYDLMIKNLINKYGTKFNNYLHGYITKKPKLCIILEDKPGNIYKRKQELTEESILKYQGLLKNVMKKLNVNNSVVNIENKSKNEIASIVAKLILENSSESLITMFRKHTYAMENNFNVE